MAEIIVVGGGASGLLAAIAAARNGAEVTILEKMEKPGRKLLMTGNGRCNLTNTAMSETGAYRGELPEFACRVLEQFGAEDTLDFFHGLGVLTKERAGYIYPYTDQASTVLEALLLEVRRLGILLKCREEVQRIQPTAEGYRVCTSTWQYPCRKVILAAGSKAAPLSGSAGDGYRIAEELGHHIQTPLPALVPLKLRESFADMVSGIRCQAEVTLLIDGKSWITERGELQWTSYGVSGIVVFQISRFAVRALQEGRDVRVCLDLLPFWKEEELNEMAEDLSAEALLNGLFQKKIQSALFRHCFRKKQFCPAKEEVRILLKTAKRLILSVHGYKDFDAAQVCSGGISVREVDPRTLESTLKPGLYLTGEVLDIDGICGGYNLQWAWSTGYLAGTDAASENSRKTGEKIP